MQIYIDMAEGHKLQVDSMNYEIYSWHRPVCSCGWKGEWRKTQDSCMGSYTSHLYDVHFDKIFGGRND